MARHERFTGRAPGARGRRLASWLVLGLTLVALGAAVWPGRASAAIEASTLQRSAFTPAQVTDPQVEALQGATRVTFASHTISDAILRQATVDAAFQAYYDANAGPQSLGAPLTPAFLTQQGLTQFFEDGELVLLTASSTVSSADGGSLQNLDAIQRYSLLDSLMQLGSTAPVGGETSSVTFLDLRAAVVSSPLVSASLLGATLAAGVDGASDGATDDGGVFVASAGSGTEALGRLVPTPIWAYIQQTDVSPQGWQVSFGAPLTEALPVIATVDGTLRHELVQVFSYGAVVMDDTDAAEGADDTVYRLPTGVAYLETVGMPAVVAPKGASFWAARDTAILPNPAGGDAEAHIGQNFPLTLTGAASWVDGALWYGVAWKTPGRSGEGWLPATDGTLIAPDPGSPSTEGFDLLSTDLEQYLEQYGDRVGAYVYDVTRNAAYSYNSSGLFTVASSVKVPIMLTFLTMTEQQGREPNSNEMALLTTMIENSNNDSAQALWDEVGGGPAVASYLQTVGVTDFQPNNVDGWGWSRISPLSMVHLLTLLHNNEVLTAQDRQLALYLMNNIEIDEQTGVGDTAPAGATVYMKDGWVPGPDGMWVMNTTGMVTLGGETYIISVYTDDDDSLQQGWDITRHVCQIVGQLLT